MNPVRDLFVIFLTGVFIKKIVTLLIAINLRRPIDYEGLSLTG